MPWNHPSSQVPLQLRQVLLLPLGWGMGQLLTALKGWGCPVSSVAWH